MKNYIDGTGAELWIPLYPLIPDYNLPEEAEFTVKLHKKMLERFPTQNIVWLGFSAGADLLLRAGRHIIQMYFAGNKVFSGLAPDYEKSFKRSGVKDHTIKIVPNMFHG